MNKDILDRINNIREDAFSRHLPVMRFETCKILAGIVNDIKPSQVLEVGTCVGVSGLTVLNNANCLLTTIEKDEDRIGEAKKNFADNGFTVNVLAICGDCNEVVPMLYGNRYQLAIIDGPKSSTGNLFDCILPMIDVGGVIFIDDIDYHGFIAQEGAPHKQRTIILAIRNFLKKLETLTNIEIKKYDIDDGVLVIKKVSE